MNLKQLTNKISDAQNPKMSVLELRKTIAEHFGISLKDVEAKRSYDQIYGSAYVGKARYNFDYNSWKENGINIRKKPEFVVTYLRETPYGYGGGWCTVKVEATDENEALTKVQEQCNNYWGKKSPCSKFKVEFWNNENKHTSQTVF